MPDTTETRDDDNPHEDQVWRNLVGWQDISTAPKDGTWVVLFGPHSRHGVDAHIICRWDGDYWQSSDDGYGAYIRPGDRTDSGEAQDGSLNQTSINASPKPEGE